MPGLLSDALAWVVILTFAVGALSEDRNQRLARYATVAAWVGFAVFWLQLVPHFAFVHKSYVEGVLAVAAVPASLYTGYLLWNGRDSLYVLSRAVAAMGLVSSLDCVKNTRMGSCNAMAASILGSVPLR